MLIWKRQHEKVRMVLRILGVTVAVILAFLFGYSLWSPEIGSRSPFMQQETPAMKEVLDDINSPPAPTLAEFNEVKKGMSYEEVVAIFGSHGEVSSDEFGIITYKWGFATTTASCFFKNGKLIRKSEYGLK